MLSRYTKRGLRVSSALDVEGYVVVAFWRAEMLKAVIRHLMTFYQARLEQLKYIEC